MEPIVTFEVRTDPMNERRFLPALLAFAAAAFVGGNFDRARYQELHRSFGGGNHHKTPRYHPPLAVLRARRKFERHNRRAAQRRLRQAA